MTPRPPRQIVPFPLLASSNGPSSWRLFLFFLTYLAAQGLSCGTQDICCHRQDLQLWRVNSSSQTKPRTCAPLRWKHAVLTTGPPGKSLAPFSYQQLQRALRACVRSPRVPPFTPPAPTVLTITASHGPSSFSPSPGQGHPHLLLKGRSLC